MAAKDKLQNISIQPVVRRLHSIKKIFELPRENLSEADLMRKSTSDRTKRRVAHVAWFPLPVIKKPILIPDKKKNNKKEDRSNKPIHFYEQCSETIYTKNNKKNQPKKNGATVPPVKLIKKDHVSVKKRKPENGNANETTKKRQKKDTPSSWYINK